MPRVEGSLRVDCKSRESQGISGQPRRSKLRQGLGNRNNHALPPPLGVIEVIQTTSMGVSLNSERGILSVVTPPKVDATDRPKKWPRRI